ncbi:RNA-directed DNA polymerase, eukaryota [Tanacetum coccineum]
MIIAVYAPHDPRDKRMLWDYLAHVINQWQGEVVIMGDFNEVRVKSDRFGTNFNVLGANIFNSFINSTGLEEVHLGGRHHFDRFYPITDRFFFRESALMYGPSLSILSPLVSSRGLNDFRDFHLEFCPSVDSNGILSTIANLKKELNQLDAVIDKGTCTEVEAEKRMEVLAALRNIDHIHSMDLAQKAKIKWSIEGDENSNFFHGILNKKRNQEHTGLLQGRRLEGQPNDVNIILSLVSDRFLNLGEALQYDRISKKLFLKIQSRTSSVKFLKQEIKRLFGLWHNPKSPGPERFIFALSLFWPVY